MLSPDDKAKLLQLCQQAGGGEQQIVIELTEPRRYVLRPNGSADQAIANAALWSIARDSILALLEELSQSKPNTVPTGFPILEARDMAMLSGEATDGPIRSDQLAAGPPGVS